MNDIYKVLHILGCSSCKYFNSSETLMSCSKHGILIKRYDHPCTYFTKKGEEKSDKQSDLIGQDSPRY